jgi:putative transposase
LHNNPGEAPKTNLYSVQRVYLGKSEHLDALAHACGELYSRTVVSYWRMVRKHGLWLHPKHLMRWQTSDQLHAHTADATVQAFFAALDSWRQRRKMDPKARPPRRRKWYFRIEYKGTAMRLTDGRLILSNGRGHAPLVLTWPYPLPKTVVIRWAGTQYEAIATYVQAKPDCQPLGTEIAGIDLGEVHLGVAHDGQQTCIVNGRELRAKRRYQNKLKSKLSSLIDTKQKGSCRRKRLIRSKRKQLRKLRTQIKDLLHKQTSRLITTLHERGVQTLVIGDVRAIRQDNDKGAVANQKLHQWAAGQTRWYLTYKAEKYGMQVVLQDERHTSRTCPVCGQWRKSAPEGRVFRCPACGFVYHRDGIGAMNIRAKYRGEMGCPHVVGDMAPPTGLRYLPHIRCSSLPLDGNQHHRRREAAPL